MNAGLSNPPSGQGPVAQRAAGGVAVDGPDWPRTQRPLRIAILGWARLSSQAKEGSGYNLSASELARGLALMGHAVAYLSSGMSYRTGWFGLGIGSPRIARREAWAGIECDEVRNSPILSPAACNFGNLSDEMSNPRVTALVMRWLDQKQIQLVHIHALEGFGFDLIAAIEASGRRVVVTPHNYHFACPQVDLLHKEREVCVDYDGGRKCEGCLKPGRHRSMQVTRAIGQTLEYRVGGYAADVLRKFAYGTPGFLKKLAKGKVSLRHEPPILNPDRHDDVEFAAGHSARVESSASANVLSEGTSLQGDARPYARSPLDQNERVLQNDRHLVVLNDFGKRRIAGLEALKSASLITPPSDYLRRVHVSMGVPEAKTRWVKLGQPHFDEINRRARRSPFYDVRPWDAATATRPLRFAFYGTTRPNKGLEVFARAIPLVDRELRERCHFVIHAAGDDAAFRRRLRQIPQVQVWPGYELAQLSAGFGEYDVGVLSHIWLENSPLVLLEHLHAGKFVLAPRLGGVVDFVREPRGVAADAGNPERERGAEIPASSGAPESASHPGASRSIAYAQGSPASDLGNGLLFDGGDESDLAACIERLVTGRVAIPSAREVHAISTLRSYPEHVREFDGIYQDLISRQGPRADANGRPLTVTVPRAAAVPSRV